MAHEKQGLQIALILFVMSTVFLAVLSYFTYTSSAESADELELAQTELREARQLRDAFESKAQILEMWIGFGDLTQEEADAMLTELERTAPDVFTEVSEMKQQYDTDMALYDASYAGARDYRSLPNTLQSTITQKNDTIEQSVNTEKKLIADKDAGIAAAIKGQESAEAALQTATETYESDRDTWRTASEDIARTQQLSQQAANTAGQRVNQIETESRDAIATRDERIGVLQGDVNLLSAKIEEYEVEKFEVADGRITDLSTRSGVVWINVGFADILPPNATFSVYPADSTQFRPEGIKGTIEVKRILGAHTAEAKITSSSLDSPILAGDMINTTTWSPGRRQTFAVTGYIDIDNDGREDSARLRNIITRNGGEVVAYVDEEGNTQGELLATTRYLITGDVYKSSTVDGDTLGRLSDSNSAMITAATEKAVEIMPYQELLEEIGYRGETAADKVGGGEGFTPRRAPARGSDGAF